MASGLETAHLAPAAPQYRLTATVADTAISIPSAKLAVVWWPSKAEGVGISVVVAVVDGHTSLATGRHAPPRAPACKAARIEAPLMASSPVAAVADTYVLAAVADARPILAAIEAAPLLAAEADTRPASTA